MHERKYNLNGLCDTLYELQRCVESFKPFNSNYESYAVLKEEVDALWDEVKKKTPDKGRIRSEAVKVAAVALRIINDLT